MGFSLSEMQAWDQKGRKKTKAEQFNEFLGAVTQGMKDRRARDMENQKLTIEAGKSGYTPVEKQGGLGGILKGLMSSGAPKYEYTGVAPTALEKAQIANYQASAADSLAKAAGTWYYDKDTSFANRADYAAVLDTAKKLAKAKASQGMKSWQDAPEPTYDQIMAEMGNAKQLLQTGGIQSSPQGLQIGGMLDPNSPLPSVLAQLASTPDQQATPTQGSGQSYTASPPPRNTLTRKAQYNIGQTITAKNGKQYEIVGFDTDGEPLVEPK